MGPIARYTKTAAFRRGMVKGDPNWRMVWLVLTGLSWLRSRGGKTERKVLRLTLEPGDRYVISNLPPEEQ
jgi:hypothetical protein